MEKSYNHELEKLKSDWLADPIWDIEETEGFEEHKEELLAFRLKQEKAWEEEQNAKKEEEIAYTESIGVVDLYKIIQKQQEQFRKYENAIRFLVDGKHYEAHRALNYGYEYQG
ncbi:hypothetical protein GAG94_03185 [Lysinibacillus sphaericus]|nr:hypothetical protein GAG94_03185 [Lysinibacillus sphaericus]